MNRLLLTTACLTLLLSACSKGVPAPPEENPPAPIVVEEPTTRNVSFTGTVEELGITIFQQGTHRLTVDENTFILLESTDQGLDLNKYLGRSVEVKGSVQPTIEEGSSIMRVEQVTILDEEAAEEDKDQDEEKKNEGDEGSSSSEESSSSSPASSSSFSSSSSENKSASEESSSEITVTETIDVDSPDAQEEAIEAMASQQYTDAAEWKQEYCTSHIGFCIPVHRNWYYKSFGTTTSNLWHVEFGLEAVEELGDGTILFYLVPGVSSAKGGTSGEVQTDGNTAIGYLDWEEDKHFEVVADARLVDAVFYMIKNITSFVPDEK